MSASQIPVIRAGDRANNLVFVLATRTVDSEDGISYANRDLSAAGTVVTAYIREKDDETNLLTVTCTLTDADIGEGEMSWPANWEDSLPDKGDTDGKFEVHFVVTAGGVDDTSYEPKIIRIKPKVAA